MIVSLTSCKEKKETVDVLLNVLEFDKMVEDMPKRGIASIRGAMPTITDEDFELCKKAVLSVKSENLLNSWRNIYLDNFSEAEMKVLINFYRTPTGKRSITRLPIVHKELNTEFEKVSKETSTKIYKIFVEKGYIKAKDE
jgi:uncharacterized protein